MNTDPSQSRIPDPSAPALSRSRLPVPGLSRPRTAPERGIVHLGLGNFHRAHQAVYTAEALRHTEGPWGITGVVTGPTQRSRTVVEGMTAQDELYTVLTLGRDGSVRADVPGVHHAGLLGGDQAEAVVDAIGDAATRIVTLTVTEKGYTFTPSGGLDLDDPRVAADLTGTAAPRTPLGLLLRGLQRRVRTHAAPLTVLPCDNLMDNGSRTRRLLDEFASALPSGEREELTAYLASSVSTPSTMVDRIAPATTDAHRALVTRHFGVRDAVPVPAEPYRLWVLQDDFRAGRPAWEKAGAVFTPEVAGYETMKLRLLNGAHSLLAYLGLLLGHPSVDRAVGDPGLGAVVRHAMTREILPSVEVPDGVDGAAYIEELLERFANPALGHRTSQVATDGSLKIPVRWAGPLAHRLASGTVPEVLALGVAAYIRIVTRGGEAYDERALGAVRDDATDRLRALAGRAGEPGAAARLVVEAGGLLPEPVAGSAEFTDRVAAHARDLARHGARATVDAALRAASTRPAQKPQKQQSQQKTQEPQEP
ncbi:mannitol dehydrogenase family protein [Streptomyces sp. NPDC059134]|uniref:mannitol dehydrogenase family protein n=1 Tax=Streptomyces sp. NPDC059134 TaxID=3346738 RepID=UPI00369240DA